MKGILVKGIIAVIVLALLGGAAYAGHWAGMNFKDRAHVKKHISTEQRINVKSQKKKDSTYRDDTPPYKAHGKIATTQDNPNGDDYSIVPDGDVLPEVTARSAIVMEADTGKIIYQRNAHELRYPASTTKMMTLIVALENADLDEVVTTSENAYGAEGSTMWLEVGERLTMEQMLYGIMLVSGNDATIAVAEHIAGSVPRFANMMTNKAHDIGATDTYFKNPNGLPDPEHYSTAYDLALIAAYGYKNPMFVKIVSTKEKFVPWSINDYDRTLTNENQMLWLYDGANGVKTGYTDAAGRCLVSAAKRDGVQLIVVVLDALYMWNDSIALLDYGFKQVKRIR